MSRKDRIVAVVGAGLAATVPLVGRDALWWLPPDVVPVVSWGAGAVAVVLVIYVIASFRHRKPVPVGGTEIEFTMADPPQPRDQSCLTPLPASHAVLPYAGAADFAGRVAERKGLSEWLGDDSAATVRVLVAPGGTGKTALAWAWMKRDVLGETLPGTDDDPPEILAACRVAPTPRHVLWWSFDRPGATFSVFLDEAISYLSDGSIGTGRYLSSRSEKVDNLLRLLREGRYLLILDGLERELRAFAGLTYRGDEYRHEEDGDHLLSAGLHAAEFMRRLPAEPMDSRVLMTTRLVPAELDDPSQDRVDVTELAGLAPADAVTLLQRCGVEGAQAELEAACADRQFHPLSIRLAAGMLTGGGDHGHVQDARHVGIPRSDGGAGHVRLITAALAALDVKTRAMLSHIATIRGPITAEQAAMFDPYRDGAPITVTLHELVARGLVMHDAGPDRYDIHPVVRAAAYRRLSDPVRTHSHLAEYFAQAKLPVQITRIEELQPAIERYHHLVRAHRYEEAAGLLSDRLVNQLRDRFADQQLLMQLLRGLFDGTRPCLNDPRDRAWAVEALARACSYSGETRRAAAMCEANVTAFAATESHEQLVMVLETLAGVQMRLGAVRKAEQSLRRLVELTTSLQRPEQEAVARNRLGLLLAHRGLFDEAIDQLDAAYKLVKDLADRQIQSVCFSYYTQRALLMHDPDAALVAAQKSRALVEEAARRTEPNEHDYVRSGWLLGAACLAMARAGRGEKKGHLDKAQRYLHDALSRCRRNDLVGFEPDLLLAWAGWHRLSGDPESAARVARDALAIADRCDYRLKKAEAHNCLAWLAIESGDALTAQGSAEIAWNCADCDGAPWYYKTARDEAEAILGALGVKATPPAEPQPDAPAEPLEAGDQPGRSQAA